MSRIHIIIYNIICVCVCIGVMVEAYGRRFLIVGDIVFGVLMGKIIESEDGYRWYVERQDHMLPLRPDERWLIMILRDLAENNMILVDVGAHVGKYCIRLAGYYKHVYAIEPNPISRKILLRNLKLNFISNVTVLPYACGKKKTTMTLYDRGGSSTMLKEYASKKSFKIEVRRLDELVNVAHVIKIDVEGLEYDVIQGAQKLIDNCKPILLIEHHERRGYKKLENLREKIIKTLKGYVYIELDDSHNIYFPENYDFFKNLDKVWRVFVTFWVHYMFKMTLERGCWYYGLPSSWWHGCNQLETILELIENFKNIALEDEAWIKNAIKKCGG